jgi:hypothetical protein
MEAGQSRNCVSVAFENNCFDSKALALRHYHTYDHIDPFWNHPFRDVSV